MGAQQPADTTTLAHGRTGGRQVCPILIGRDDLLALAGRRLAEAGGGTGQLLFLAGEAGIGKTRLLTEIIKSARGQGFIVAKANAFPRDIEVAGGVLADLATGLRRAATALRAQPDEPPDRGAVIADAGGRLTARLQDTRDGGRSGDAHRQHRLLVTELAEAIVALGTGPVLITLEDLHWADDLTLEVLDRVARQLATVPVLVVCTYRTDELYPRLPMRTWRTTLLNQRLAEEARLGRLSSGDTAAMIAAISETLLPTTTTGAVFAHSDGIPLHVEEFLATIGGAGPDAGVPDTLADAVLARAAMLTPQARDLAAAASIIGRSFDIDLLTAITGEQPGHIDTGLRELTDRFFVAPHSDRSTYDFRHALIRDALYADLPPHRRRELHDRAASAATEAGLAHAVISDHHEHAGNPAQAFAHAMAGAAEAAAISAHREAVDLYRRAQRTTPGVTSGASRAALLTALAGELAATDDNVAAAAAYDEAYALRRALGDDEAAAALVPAIVAVRHLLGASLAERTGLLGDALGLIAPATGPAAREIRMRLHAARSAAYMLDRRLDEAIEDGEYARAIGSGDPAAMSNIDATLGCVLVFNGRMDEGFGLMTDAVARATAAGAESEAARGYRMIGTSSSVLVEYGIALRWLREGIEYAERAERFNDRHYMAAHLGHVLWATGDWEGARHEARYALADGRGGITTRITALHVLGYLSLGQGDWTAAREHLSEAADLGGQMRELQRMSPAWWGLAETSLHQGRPAESAEWCERGLTASAAVRDAAYLFPYVLTGVRAYLGTGDPAGARDWADRAARLLDARGIPGTLGAIGHARGLLYLNDGQTGKAREALETATAFWDHRNRFWEGTQSLVDQARCAARSRRPAEAADLVRQAKERAASTGAATLSGAADRVLTGGTAPATAPVLTARESEVAKLVATGATNRQIAETLFIAPKTVAAHVEHILAKLGASRRAQIASWAATRDSDA